MNDLVTVIIAAYNTENFISTAISSAFNQSYKNIEVIVVDDCSSDSTVQIVESLKPIYPALKLLKHETNMGPAAARNTAIDHAKGDWVSVLDSDDAYEYNRIEYLLEKISCNCDLVFDNLMVKDGEKKIPMFHENFVQEFCSPLTLENYFNGNLIECKGFTLGYLKPLFSKSFINKNHIRYNDSIKIGEDYILIIEFFLNGANVEFIDNPLYIYNVRDTSISYRLSVKDVNKLILADKYIIKKYGVNYLPNNLLVDREKKLKNMLAYNLIVEGIKFKSPTIFFKGLIKSPMAIFGLREPIFNRIGINKNE